MGHKGYTIKHMFDSMHFDQAAIYSGLTNVPNKMLYNYYVLSMILGFNQDLSCILQIHYK